MVARSNILQFLDLVDTHETCFNETPKMQDKLAVHHQSSKGPSMLKIAITSITAILISVPAFAAEVTYRKDILPIWQAKCAACHGAQSPYLGDFEENKKQFEKAMKGPRMDTYAGLIFFVGWPDSGALMRRLDDGSNAANRKPGNMYQNLGSTEEERQANLKVFKAWVGEDAWVLKRWYMKGHAHGATKQELSKLKLKY